MTEYSNIGNADYLKSLIYTVRGVKIMLDADLAVLYGYTTRTFNQQVKNNIAKFDDDFRFQLTKEEYQFILRSKNLTLGMNIMSNVSKENDNNNDLMSKNLTSSWGGTRKLPYAFTEQGIYMLMTVLKGELATRQSKALIRAFKEMKDFIVDNRNLIGTQAIAQLSLQTVQNTKDISEIKQDMVSKADLAKVIHDFTDLKLRHEYLILNGEPVEADIAYNTIYKTAKRSIFVVDNYIGLKTLVLLKETSHKVPIVIFSDNLGKGLHQSDYADFCNQYPTLSITFRQTCGIFHDRYIILDYNARSERIYHCGASSKDAGNKVNTIIEVKDKEVYHPIVDILLDNPLLSL